MSLHFSEQPGPRERHLRRKANNPLFPESVRHVTQEDIEKARQQDNVELINFMNEFQVLVQEAIDLKPETDSEVILSLKERLDKSYAQCCALPGDQAQIKQAVKKLIDAVMTAIHSGAGTDPKALKELQEEQQAREIHFALHDHPLVADLMLDDSPVMQDELVASLLNETEEGLTAALNLFEEEALSALYQQAKSLLQSIGNSETTLEQAWQNLHMMENFLTRLASDHNPRN
ncbi:MAG: hypothetical protein P8Y24_10075 [Gammaproteobacteria bacterium]